MLRDEIQAGIVSLEGGKGGQVASGYILVMVQIAKFEREVRCSRGTDKDAYEKTNQNASFHDHSLPIMQSVYSEAS
jgi:hypothetical protein